MRVFCRNYKCKYIRMLDTPIRFSYRKHYTHLGNDDGYCTGECQKEFPGFSASEDSTQLAVYKMSECSIGANDICKFDCLLNTNGKCMRDEILVDKQSVGDREHWICKCKSNINISGHMDWSRFGQKKDMF